MTTFIKSLFILSYISSKNLYQFADIRPSTSLHRIHIVENSLHSSNNLMATEGLYNENTNEFGLCTSFQMDFVCDVVWEFFHIFRRHLFSVKCCKSLGLLLVFVVSRKGGDMNLSFSILLRKRSPYRVRKGPHGILYPLVVVKGDEKLAPPRKEQRKPLQKQNKKPGPVS